MGQVITLLPLLERTIIVQDDGFSNLVRATANSRTSGSEKNKVLPTIGVRGGAVSASSVPQNKPVTRTRPTVIGRLDNAVPVNPPPPSGGGDDYNDIPVTPDYGTIPEGGGGFGIGGGFPEDSGDFETPQTQEEYPVLGTDSYGCPYYGLDEAGRPLYGIDQNGNVITDPTVLPCGMKGQEAPVSDVSPVSQIVNDKTLKTALLVVAGLVVFTLLVKKK
jgi:hypothetical protein